MNRRKYKQLPLTGGQNDYGDSLDQLKGFTELLKALSKFFEDNKEFNPRQLEYIVGTETMDLSLNELVFWDDTERKNNE